ncbi:hypothetical protein CTEN210_16745 [Chaetoceros tenuissimus]|uniref:J domain-containing protein n=1 Tax=Chaetoceros tenuissimus TaxID=426638 RepID=A0AAD3DCS0_9STRA|nr:hypothetical protein CTEN210_16745 [Chaetoceros tenuissimus]
MNNQQEGNQDLYETLNIPRSATSSQIKSAYRKLALKYHPDRQSSPEEKQKCSEIFTKISNAYEVLSDKQRKENYDRFGVVDDANTAASSQQTRAPQGFGFSSDPFGSSFFGGRDPFADPFFGGLGNMNGGGRPRGFMDPFSMFQDFFGDEFSHQFHNEDYLPNRQRQQNGFSNSFMGGGFGNHMNMMNNMMNMHAQQFSQGFPQQQQGFTSYSSSSFGGGNGGVRESVSTSTRIINGKRQTVTERVRINPDGTVERHTETTGDDDFPTQYLNNGNGVGMLQQQQQQYLDNQAASNINSYQRNNTGSSHNDEHKHESEEPSDQPKKRRFFGRRNNSK